MQAEEKNILYSDFYNQIESDEKNTNVSFPEELKDYLFSWEREGIKCEYKMEADADFLSLKATAQTSKSEDELYDIVQDFGDENIRCFTDGSEITVQGVLNFGNIADEDDQKKKVKLVFSKFISVIEQDIMPLCNNDVTEKLTSEITAPTKPVSPMDAPKTEKDVVEKNAEVQEKTTVEVMNKEEVQVKEEPKKVIDSQPVTKKEIDYTASSEPSIATMMKDINEMFAEKEKLFAERESLLQHKKRNLEEESQKVRSLAADVESREKHLEARKELLDSKELTIVEKQDSLQEKEDSLNKKEYDLNVKMVELSKREKEVITNEELIASETKRLDEMQVYVEKSEKLKKELDDKTEILSTREKALEIKITMLEEKEKLIKEMKEEGLSLDDDNSKAELDSQKLLVEQLRTEKKALEEQISAFQSEKEKEVTDLQSKIDSLGQELTQVKDNANQTEKMIDSSALEKITEELNDTKSELEKSKTELDSSKTTITSLEEQIAKLKEDNEKLLSAKPTVEHVSTFEVLTRAGYEAAVADSDGPLMYVFQKDDIQFAVRDDLKIVYAEKRKKISEKRIRELRNGDISGFYELDGKMFKIKKVYISLAETIEEMIKLMNE